VNSLTLNIRILRKQSAARYIHYRRDVYCLRDRDESYLHSMRARLRFDFSSFLFFFTFLVCIIYSHVNIYDLCNFFPRLLLLFFFSPAGKTRRSKQLPHCTNGLSTNFGRTWESKTAPHSTRRARAFRSFCVCVGFFFLLHCYV